MRFLVLLLALLLACPGARAQLLPAAPPAALGPAVAPTTTPDTAAALHRLFARQRHKSHTTWKVGGALLVSSSILVASVAHESGYQYLGIALSGLLGAVASVPVITTGLLHNAAYSKKQEQRTLLAWQQHRLPRRLQRALETDSVLATQVRLARATLAASSPAVAATAARDTAAALHQLFAAKRRMIKIVLPLTVAASLGFVPKVTRNSPNFGNTEAILIGTTTLLVAGELAVLRKYSKKHEAQALLALKEHRLPTWQRQELKTEYFRPAKATP